MAVLTKIHCNLSVITASGEDIDIRPLVDGKDVMISANSNSGGTAQSLVDALGNIAFIRKFDGIDDSKGLEAETLCYSINKINSVKSTASAIVGNCKSEYSGWF